MDIDQDFVNVLTRLQGALGTQRGKLRVSDALVLAGFDRPSFHRSRLVSRAMKALGWERRRYRIHGSLEYAYARGSLLEREAVLYVEAVDAQHVVKRREP